MPEPLALQPPGPGLLLHLPEMPGFVQPMRCPQSLGLQEAWRHPAQALGCTHPHIHAQGAGDPGTTPTLPRGALG